MKRLFWDVIADTDTYRVFETLLSPEEDLDLIDILKKGIPFGEKWKLLPLRFWEGDKGYMRKEKRKPVADFTQITLMPLISLRGRAVIEPLTGNQVEFLPFETPVSLYYGLHVQYVDCLDAARAEAIHFKSSGRIMEVTKYAFHWDRLKNMHIFRLPELGLSRLFVSDAFKQVVEENRLTGLLFYPVPLVEEGGQG